MRAYQFEKNLKKKICASSSPREKGLYIEHQVIGDTVATQKNNRRHKVQVPGGVEPSPADSESAVITVRPWNQHKWCSTFHGQLKYAAIRISYKLFENGPLRLYFNPLNHPRCSHLPYIYVYLKKNC